MTLAQFIIWLGIYIGLIVPYQLLSHIEHRKHSEKRQRYQALPLRFKMGCAFIAMPIFATSIYGTLNGNEGLHFTWIIAVIIGLWIERNAVIWYKENGLF